MSENKNQYAKTLGDKQLKDVSGGNTTYSKCPICEKQSYFFVPGKGAECNECGFKTKRLAK